MVKNWIAGGMIVSSLLFAGCSKEQVKSEVFPPEQEEQIDRSEIDSLQARIDFLTEQNQHLTDTLAELTSRMPDEEKLKLAMEQVEYGIKMNEVAVPKTGRMEITEGPVEIVISEKVNGIDFLPYEWLEKGKISGDYLDHLSGVPADWTPVGYDGTVNTARGYRTEKVEKGQQLIFTITEELLGRIGLETAEIQIEVK